MYCDIVCQYVTTVWCVWLQAATGNTLQNNSNTEPDGSSYILLGRKYVQLSFPK